MYQRDVHKGLLAEGDRQDARREQEHGRQVPGRGPVAQGPGHQDARLPDDGALRRRGPRVARGGRPRPEEAAPYRQESLRPPGRRARLRRLPLDGRALREGMEGGEGPLAHGRVPRARLARRSCAGRLRQRDRGARRVGGGAPRAGGELPPLQRPLLRLLHVAEVGVSLRVDDAGLRARRRRPPHARARQRDRGRQAARRGRAGERPVHGVQAAPGLRGQVLQPLRGPREGLRRERGRVPEAQPDGARPRGRGPRRAQRAPRWASCSPRTGRRCCRSPPRASTP